MANSGMITTALQTVGVRVDMDDAIVLLSTWDAPLQKRLPSRPTNETRIDWLEDDLTPQEATVTSFTGTGPWTVTTPDSTMLRVNDILWDKTNGTQAVQFQVTSIADSTHFVIAGFNANVTGPTNADVLQIIGTLPTEGGDPGAMRSVDRTNPFNYTQIGQEGVQVSRTERKRAVYGVADEYTYQVQKKFKELAIRTERSFTNGVRFQSGATRFMGGLFSYITTNTVSDVIANAKAAVNSLARKCYEQGGTPRTLYVSPAIKVALSSGFDPTLRRIDRTDTQGGFVIESILTDFGNIDVIVDRHFPTKKALLLQEEYDTRRVFDGYFHEMLAKTGDGDKGEIVGEFTLEVKNQKAQGLLTLTDAV
jgi:hypothetical protein